LKKLDSTAQVDSDHGHYSSASRFAEQRELVQAVAQTYREVSGFSVLIAFDPTRDASDPAPNKWTPTICHFKVDTENAVRRAIEARPESEHQAMWEAWVNLLSDDPKFYPTTQKLIRLLAGPFFTKRLHPRLYFRVSVR
jgi:hypothetical protein